MIKHYYLGIDALRILAILAVIMIHTSILTIQNVDHNITHLPFTFLLNQAAIFAVPLFFLVSGFVLELQYKTIHYATYFKKRAARIVIPYLFWSTFYFLLYPAGVPKGMSYAWALVKGAAAYQLYFIPSLIVLYLCFPLLHKYYGVITKKPILISLLIGEVLLQAYDYFYGPFDIGKALRVILLSFILFPLGMIASHHEQKIVSFTKKYIKLLLLLFVVMLTVIFLQGWYYYTITHHLQAVYSQYNIFVIPYTILVALPVFFYYSSHDTYSWLIVRLSKLSFLVFFIHVAIIYTFWGSVKPVFLQMQTGFERDILFPLGFFFFITIMSFLIADLLHRIPKLKDITG